MSKKAPVIALMYDVDKTLCPKDMQEYTLIPNMGLAAADFWKESNEMAKALGMDGILAYMYQMIRKSGNAGIPIRRENFVEAGKSIAFFPGVEDWFDRINEFGKEQGAKIEHYIISSGMKEMIEGSSIKKAFKKIYACEFHYDENGVADWPAVVVNYTTKTQFLFRINKGVLDVSEDRELNRYVPEDERPIPFRNMIYFGDGITDIPCMKLVHTNGGKSIAVFQKKTKQTAEELLRDNRVNYISPADYTAGSELDELVKSIIRQMVANDALINLTQKQRSKISKC